MSARNQSMEYQLWNVDYVGDMELLEHIQRKWTRAISGMSDMPHDERRRYLDLFSVKGRLLRADLIRVWKLLKYQSPLSPDGLFVFLPIRNNRNHSFNIFLPRA